MWTPCGRGVGAGQHDVADVASRFSGIGLFDPFDSPSGQGVSATFATPWVRRTPDASVLTRDVASVACVRVTTEIALLTPFPSFYPRVLYAPRTQATSATVSRKGFPQGENAAPDPCRNKDLYTSTDASNDLPHIGAPYAAGPAAEHVSARLAWFLRVQPQPEAALPRPASATPKPSLHEQRNPLCCRPLMIY